MLKHIIAQIQKSYIIIFDINKKNDIFVLSNLIIILNISINDITHFI